MREPPVVDVRMHWVDDNMMTYDDDHLVENIRDEADAQLLDRWAAGDNRAAAELFERHGPSLRRLFASRVPHAADDLTQATMLACIESRAQLRERSSFKAYLFGIARYQLFGHYRRRGVERDRQDYNTTSIYCPAGSPSTQAIRQNQDSVLLQALGSLPGSMQMVLMLKYWEDMSPIEISEVLRISINAVNNRLHRARQRLRETLATLEQPS